MPSTESPKTRERREPWLPKGVRRVGRDRFQFRAYVGPVRMAHSVNMGIYPSVHVAKMVARRFWQLLAGGMTVEAITDTMIAEGLVNPAITNRAVFPVEGGWGVYARSRGVKTTIPGPFPTPGAARHAAARWLDSLR